jgi:hypothetical protein
LPGELDQKVQALVKKWNDQLRPEGVVEISLVKSAVVNSCKLDWLSSQYNAIVTQQVRQAGMRFDAQERRAAAQEAETLAEFPLETKKTLENSAAGCDWLIEEWELLREAVAEGWSEEQCIHGYHMLGIDPQALNEEHDLIQNLIHAASASPPENVEAPDEAKVVLRAMIQATMDALAELRDQHWKSEDGQLRAEKQAAALIPKGKWGNLWPRYQGIALKGYHQAIHDLIKIRKLDDPVRPNDFRRPTTGAPNEPNESTQPPQGEWNSDDRAAAFQQALKLSDLENKTLKQQVSQLTMKVEFQAKAMNGMEQRFEAQIAQRNGAPNEANHTPQTTASKPNLVKTPSAPRQVFKAAAVLIAIFLAAWAWTNRKEDGERAEIRRNIQTDTPREADRTEKSNENTLISNWNGTNPSGANRIGAASPPAAVFFSVSARANAQ